MSSGNSSAIAVPKGSDVRLQIISPHNFVFVAPPGVKAELEMFTKPGIAGLFTFDGGLTWPDRAGCKAATVYLGTGFPICLQFDDLASAMTCAKRFRDLAQ
jgi:hypothetical protein